MVLADDDNDEDIILLLLSVTKRGDPEGGWRCWKIKGADEDETGTKKEGGVNFGRE